MSETTRAILDLLQIIGVKDMEVITDATRHAFGAISDDEIQLLNDMIVSMYKATEI